MYFADQEKVGDTTVLSFDWEHNLANYGIVDCTVGGKRVRFSGNRCI